MVDNTVSSSSGSVQPAWKYWLKTARPFTLVATVSPLVVGTAIACYEGTFHIWAFLATFFSCLFLQIGTNYFNEYFDYAYGLDHAGSLGASTVIFRNEMSAGQVLGGAIGCFVLAALLGIVLAFLVGPVILLFGLAGLLIAYFYSARPFKFSSRGLGDVMVYIAMGFLMTWGAYYVHIQQWSWPAFAASVPVGFLAMAILNMNNTRDYQDDLAVNKKTLPVRFGVAFGQRFHATLLMGSYLAVTIFALVGLLPLLSLVVWVTFPLAFTNVRAVLKATDRMDYMVGIKRTARLHLQFGVVLALGILIAILLPWKI
ncbi:1,4-dihydroxy-2-naphthoate octaprenyltransferase [Ktedonospora formicarum]|uniref:1,4-dihydroxy-2-naphthoate octaprenyltransferase n=1 Tax=Ktedonospora formicarum TaxID=2778364 RepID=A0A8J3MRQ3_9CHLR|nr:1,4-dihydroxy-2-naphthoate octaprenyltransferase [Ktedonospora formicarum]GHO45235.1 1,4-dihydroxy-2-naphthoate octaprenyltransferase [Ktedonospora formicarum]